MSSFILRLIPQKTFLINRIASKVLEDLKSAASETRDDPSRYISTAINKISFLGNVPVMLESDVIAILCEVLSLYFKSNYSGFSGDIENLLETRGISFTVLEPPIPARIVGIQHYANTIISSTSTNLVLRINTPIARGNPYVAFTTDEFYNLDVMESPDLIVVTETETILLAPHDMLAGSSMEVTFYTPSVNYFFYGDKSVLNHGLKVFIGSNECRVPNTLAKIQRLLFSDPSFYTLKRDAVIGIFMSMSKILTTLSVFASGARIDSL